MMRREPILAAAFVAAVLATGVTGGARATPAGEPAVKPQTVAPTMLVALVNDRLLVTINANTAKVVNRVNVRGTSGRLIGIDMRPADGMIYGVDTQSRVYTIDPATGETMFRTQLTQTLPAGVRATLDFNPVPNLLRMIGSDGTNLRANVDTGLVTEDTDISFFAPNPFGGTTPEVIAGAYSNNVAGAKATLLWDIDNATDALYVQVPPNGGVLNAVANQLGISPTSVGFDIQTRADGINTAWLINGNMLHRLGLVSGRVLTTARVNGLNGPVRDLAVMAPQT